MSPVIHTCEQGTPEWHELRRGKVTASMFATVMAKGKTPGARSLTRDKYMRQLAGEIITGEVQESYSNSHMERGKAMEDSARQLYAFQRDVEPQQVGFITLDRCGCSPDSLVEANGMLEVKTKLPDLLIEAMLRGPHDPPPEHLAQVQGQLMVADREWCDLVAYWPKMPLVTWRIYRDPAYEERLRGEIALFTMELDALVETVRRYA